MYYEDVDLCRRAWKSGWRVVFSPTPGATHFQPYHQRTLTVAMARMARGRGSSTSGRIGRAGNFTSSPESCCSNVGGDDANKAGRRSLNSFAG